MFLEVLQTTAEHLRMFLYLLLILGFKKSLNTSSSIVAQEKYL